jgi:hypothetical protein
VGIFNVIAVTVMCQRDEDILSGFLEHDAAASSGAVVWLVVVGPVPDDVPHVPEVLGLAKVVLVVSDGFGSEDELVSCPGTGCNSSGWYLGH